MLFFFLNLLSRIIKKIENIINFILNNSIYIVIFIINIDNNKITVVRFIIIIIIIVIVATPFFINL